MVHPYEMLALAITGFDTDPTVVTETLGISPTRTACKGELGASGRPQTLNGWWFDAHADPLSDGADHARALSSILEQIRGREQQFAALRENFGPVQVTIYGGIHHAADEQCGLWLDPDDMRLLADCGVGWGVDLFVKD